MNNLVLFFVLLVMYILIEMVYIIRMIDIKIIVDVSDFPFSFTFEIRDSRTEKVTETRIFRKD